MKASAFMTGDWVLGKHGKPVKVTNVLCKALFTDDKEGLDELNDEIQPVTLTPEIMTKLGFVNQSTVYDIIYSLECGRCLITFISDGGCPILTIEDVESREADHDIICISDSVYNVHELQHAMRLINDEKLNALADNFKIN